MERRCQVDCAFMFATAGLRPSYRTISRFREGYKVQLAGLFVDVVRVCRKAGLGDTSVIAVDSTPQRANASMDAHSRRSQLERDLHNAFHGGRVARAPGGGTRPAGGRLMSGGAAKPDPTPSFDHALMTSSNLLDCPRPRWQAARAAR